MSDFTTSGRGVILPGEERTDVRLRIPERPADQLFLVKGLLVSPEVSVGGTSRDVVRLPNWAVEVPVYQHTKEGDTKVALAGLGTGPQHVNVVVPPGQIWPFVADREIPVTISILGGSPASHRFEFNVHMWGAYALPFNRLGHESAPRDETLVDRSFVTKIASFGGSNLAVELGPGNLVFTSYGSTIYTVDVEDPAFPRSLGSFSLANKVWDLRYSAGRLYVANVHHGLVILDASDPLRLRMISRLDTRGVLRGLFLDDDVLFLADGFGGLRIVDVSHPTRPREIGRALCDGRNVQGVYARDGIAYVATNSSPQPPSYGWTSETSPLEATPGGLCIVDVTQPAHIWCRSFARTDFDLAKTNSDRIRFGSDPSRSAAADVLVEGDQAYVAAHGFGVAIFNIADPDHPVPLGHWADALCVKETHANNRLLLAGTKLIAGLSCVEDPVPQPGALLIGELAALPDPQASCITTAPDNPWSLRIRNQTVYIAHDDAGMRIVDLDTLQPYGRSFLPSSPVYDVAIENNIAYVADFFSGVSLLDITNAGDPRLTRTWLRPEYDTVHAPGTSARISVSDGLIFLCRTDGFFVIDSKSEELPTVNDPAPGVVDVKVNGIYAYIASKGESVGRLAVLNISDRSKIVEAGSCPIPNPTAICFAGESVFVATLEPTAIVAVDVKIPPNPHDAVVLTPAEPVVFGAMIVDLAISGNVLAAANNRGHVDLIDVSDDSLPVIGRTPLYGRATSLPISKFPDDVQAKASAVQMHGTRMYVGYRESVITSGLRVFDISDPTHPTLVAQYDAAANVGGGDLPIVGLEIRETKAGPFSGTREVFAATEDSGLWVLRESAEEFPLCDDVLSSLR